MAQLDAVGAGPAIESGPPNQREPISRAGRARFLYMLRRRIGRRLGASSSAIAPINRDSSTCKRLGERDKATSAGDCFRPTSRARALIVSAGSSDTYQSGIARSPELERTSRAPWRSRALDSAGRPSAPTQPCAGPCMEHPPPSRTTTRAGLTASKFIDFAAQSASCAAPSRMSVRCASPCEYCPPAKCRAAPGRAASRANIYECKSNGLAFALE